MKIRKHIPGLLLAALSLTSCGDDFLDHTPSNYVTGDQLADEAQKNPEKVLQTTLDGVYTNLATYHGSKQSGAWAYLDCGLPAIGLTADCMSNDMSFADPNDIWYVDHMFMMWPAPYVRPYQMWNFFYTIIKDANSIVGSLPEPESTAAKAMKGQALALRAMSYFYLAQFYQDTYVGNEDKPGVLLNLSSGETSINDRRATLREVYTQIEDDLIAAIGLLEGYTRSSKGSVSRQVAQGLLARVYLVENRWQEAADMAHAARTGRESFPLFTQAEIYTDHENIDDAYGFNEINASEVMWGFEMTSTNTSMFAESMAWKCAVEVGNGGQAGSYKLIDAALYRQIADTDVRKSWWIEPGESYYAYNNGEEWEVTEYANLKFKRVEGWLYDAIYMRVAEMYLIEAEALARQGEGAAAATVLGELMAERDPAWNRQSVTGDDVYTQRRIELWGEGFGYFDCRRLHIGYDRDYEGSNENDAFRSIKVPDGDYRWRYQIPQSEIDNNEKLTEDDQTPAA